MHLCSMSPICSSNRPFITAACDSSFGCVNSGHIDMHGLVFISVAKTLKMELPLLQTFSEQYLKNYLTLLPYNEGAKTLGVKKKPTRCNN